MSVPLTTQDNTDVYYEILYRDKKQQLEPDTEQQTSSEWERKREGIYCHPNYLTHM